MGNPCDPPQDLVIEKLAEAARDPSEPRLQQVERHSEPAPRSGGQVSDASTACGSIPRARRSSASARRKAFSHMCLALMGPGDTAIVPAPYFPVHMYAVALASGNAITLEVADSEKFLSNIAYTCEHLYPQAEAADHQLSAQSVDGDGRAGVLCRGREAGEAVRLHGDQRLRLCRRRVRRLSAAELSGGARARTTSASSSRR